MQVALYKTRWAFGRGLDLRSLQRWTEVVINIERLTFYYSHVCVKVTLAVLTCRLGNRFHLSRHVWKKVDECMLCHFYDYSLSAFFFCSYYCSKTVSRYTLTTQTGNITLIVLAFASEFNSEIVNCILCLPWDLLQRKLTLVQCPFLNIIDRKLMVRVHLFLSIMWLLSTQAEVLMQGQGHAIIVRTH